jgi:hypothetical protein
VCLWTMFENKRQCLGILHCETVTTAGYKGITFMLWKTMFMDISEYVDRRSFFDTKIKI